MPDFVLISRDDFVTSLRYSCFGSNSVCHQLRLNLIWARIGLSPSNFSFRHAESLLDLTARSPAALPNQRGPYSISSEGQGGIKMKSTAHSAPSIIKWSSKPSDHNVIRVRNNQRRHRARAKSHVQDLEKRLEETSARLEAALQTISHLAQEVEILRGRVPPPMAWPQSPPNAATLPAVSPVAAQPLDIMPGQDVLDLELPTETPPVILNTTAAPPPAEDADDSAGCGCDGLPPQAPGESTLPCSSAFRIIEQQNFSGVEVTTIRAWLGPGFRRALRPGEACRVETNRVYELLDHITSLS